MSTKGKRTVLIILILVVLAALVLLALFGKPILWQPMPPAQPDRNHPAIPTAELLQGQVKVADRQVLKAPVAGKIVALGATETLPVVAGQLILQLDSAEARAQVQAANAALRQAQVAGSGSSPVREQLQLAQMHLDSTTAMRKQAEQQLSEFRALQPAAVQALENGIEAQQQATAAEKASRQAQAAVDAAMNSSDSSAAASAARVQRLQSALQARRQENSEAQARVQAAQEARMQQNDEIGRLQRLQREVASLEQSETRYTAELRKLQQKPAALALSRGTELVSAAQARVAQAEGLAARCALTATADGVLAELRVRPGMQVQAGQTLAVIDALAQPRLVFEVPADRAVRLSVGQQAEVCAAGGRTFAAAISQLIRQESTALVYFQPLAKMALPAPGTALTARLR